MLGKSHAPSEGRLPATRRALWRYPLAPRTGPSRAAPGSVVKQCNLKHFTECRMCPVSIITSALSVDTDWQEADKENYFPINSSRSLGLCLHPNLSFLSSPWSC